ncbi:MAG: PAS domain-containing sensor histidine kinase [Bacteroidetes bacterium]|nr:MAG: PAS domain-containing sensor histidine kinase [Bacteroidota bacterium]
MQDTLSIAIKNSLSTITFTLDTSYRYITFSSLHQSTMFAIWNAKINKGDCILDFLSEEDKIKAKKNFDRALKGESFVLVEEYGDKNIQRFFWEDKYSPVILDGKVIGVTVVAVDVSNHVEVSKKLEETQNRLNIALESSQIGVWEWDVNLDKIYWSEHMYDIFEVETNTKLKLDTYLPLLHPEDKENVLFIIQNSIANKLDYEVVHRIILKDTSIRWILGKAKMVLNQNGDVIQIIGTCLDITSQKKIETELLLKNDELTKTNAELDKFVYSASHDLRAPVASMLGLVDLARMEKNPENLIQLFELQVKSLKRMDSFIHDIIDYSRNTRLELAFSIIDFQSIINEAFEQLNFINNSVQITKNISINQHATFVSDSKRIQIVINNIISNAIKYYDAGKKDSFVNVDIEIDEQNAVLTIADNGIGIHENELAKIFNMFYRATEIGKGSGLGLYIVKEVVEKLKGKIEYKSTYGLGTEVKITLFNFLNHK